jgi:hypothetical protein
MKSLFFTENDLKNDIQIAISNSFTEKEINLFILKFKCIHFICSRIFTSIFGTMLTYFFTDFLVDIHYTLLDHILFFIFITVIDKFVFAKAHKSLFQEFYDDSGIIIRILENRKKSKS